MKILALNQCDFGATRKPEQKKVLHYFREVWKTKTLLSE